MIVFEGGGVTPSSYLMFRKPFMLMEKTNLSSLNTWVPKNISVKPMESQTQKPGQKNKSG